MKFSIGDKVVDKNDVRPYTNCTVSKVLAIVDNYYITETCGTLFNGELHEYDFYKVGDKGWHNSSYRFEEKELFSLTEASEELHRLEDAKDKLDREFNSVRAEIKAKLQQAADLVQEAGAILLTYDRTFYNLKQECKPLYQSLKEGGWSHSSMQC